MQVFSTAASIRQTIHNVGRLREIAAIFVQNGLADLVYRLRLHKLVPKGLGQNIPDIPYEKRLRQAFEALGPSFIKLGQFLSLRSDLLPQNIIVEFEKLQDEVSPVPFPQIRASLEQAIGQPLESVFLQFSEVPIAAASIAQVHCATLLDGTEVVVKAQRPGLKRIIETDLSIFVFLANLLERYIPESRVFSPTALVKELSQNLVLETDFQVEANNIRKIKENLKDFPHIAIPKVYSSLTTENCLVLEKFEGTRISHREEILAKGFNPTSLIEYGAEAFFHMILIDGLFHADLHGGNLFILNDGRIGIIDFGIVGRLSRQTRWSVLRLLLALLDEDYETFSLEYQLLCQVGDADVDSQGLERELASLIAPYFGMTLAQANIGRILLKSTAIAHQYHLAVPRELMLFFKALLTLEALGKKLDPDFDLLGSGEKLGRESLQLFAKRHSSHRQDIALLLREGQEIVHSLPPFLRRLTRQLNKIKSGAEIQKAQTQEIHFLTQRILSTLLFSLWTVSIFSFGILCFFLPSPLPMQPIPLQAIGWACLLLSLFATTYRAWYFKK